MSRFIPRVGPNYTGSYQSLFVPRRLANTIKESALTLFFPFISTIQINPRYMLASLLLPLLPSLPLHILLVLINRLLSPTGIVDC